MADIGFAGIGRGRAAEAAMIFAALRALRPEGEVGFVGGALVELAVGRADRAAELLRHAPQTEAVLAFRAMAHARAGDVGLSRELLEDLGFMRADPALVEIAQGAVSA